jgi:hypothetical protein
VTRGSHDEPLESGEEKRCREETLWPVVPTEVQRIAILLVLGWGHGADCAKCDWMPADSGLKPGGATAFHGAQSAAGRRPAEASRRSTADSTPTAPGRSRGRPRAAPGRVGLTLCYFPGRPGVRPRGWPTARRGRRCAAPLGNRRQSPWVRVLQWGAAGPSPGCAVTSGFASRDGPD